ncbi:hypothetical protein CEK26_012447 [Fusarium fujikuroi]|nr:putative acyl-CoA dehydrogenase [Fusarium fujikuroi]QGI68486.1 hypothetical protein CEK27_012457 [Fusarium fujikuroi]QGI85683.1 hypothetical protein CEK25_012412 [Fusarium fujikuroi]QGI99378.1 hypothetical protein CEK26_012447 [Fusarium fujikuroi]SCO19629.1 probable acyl-CoA dehydrogenase [Fusarium fujikuroi]
MAPQIPLAEPSWLRDLPSPFYKESHFRFQRACRAFISENLHKHAIEWERNGDVPEDLFATFVKGNFVLPALPAPLPVKWLRQLGINEMPGGVALEEWDTLHCMIYSDEMNRSGLSGPSGSISAGMAYGVPPLIHYADKQLQERLLPDLLLGKTRSCIAVTEPDAGSDVANITTTAKLSECGKYYIVDGSKKWITNGIWADYATMAVRTGPQGSGAKGISLMAVPLANTEGVTRRRMKVGGGVTSGTTYIELDEVKVPRENLIGEEGQGMQYIMRNFNHERMFFGVGITRQARVALSTAFEYCLMREAFGKPLTGQPVVRHRLAKCAAMLESHTAWLELLVYQLSHMDKAEADRQLGGFLALSKANAGMVLDECARCAVLLFGGKGYTRTGQGEIVESTSLLPNLLDLETNMRYLTAIYREVPGARIPGGSEDVLLDLAVRQLIANFQAETRALKAKGKKANL